MDETEELLDRIYEAALISDLWPDVLDRFAKIGRAEGGVLYAVTPQATSSKSVALAPIPRWTASRAAVPHVEAFVRDGWLHGNARAERAVSLRRAGFITDRDLFTEDEIEKHPFYRWARSRGLGWHLGLSVQVPTGDVMIFNFERNYMEGPVEGEVLARLDIFKAHLSRSALLSSRLGLEKAKAGAEAFSMLGLPAAILALQGRAIAMNDLFQALIPSVLVDQTGGRIRLRDGRADRLLEDALASVTRSNGNRMKSGQGQVLSVPLKATPELPAMVLHIIPVRRAARDIFGAASSVVIVTPVCRASIPSATVIQGLFDLTRAEAGIAQQIAEGGSVREIAGRAGISEATVRVQLRAIFLKTGLSKQADLIALLSHVSPTRSQTDAVSQRARH